ncbi:MAG TPA: DUF4058 family protein [Planctomycetaceae bacterium]|nr:DUF4058 family protein [Planctomycetaceae bacterium]
MLLDHFHSPLKDIRLWTGLHGMWAGKIASALNRQLPEGWFAAPTIHWAIDVDVPAFEEPAATAQPQADAPGAAVRTLPEPTKTIPFGVTTDVVEVRVYHELGELVLAGAIEFVSPANKDRPDSREAFVAKCDGYLRDGIGLVIVDVVTTRRANLHSELMQRLGEAEERDRPLYAAAYRPLIHERGSTLSVWYEPLEPGGELPTVLLFLRNGPIVEVPLAETYREACLDLKIPMQTKSGNP